MSDGRATRRCSLADMRLLRGAVLVATACAAAASAAAEPGSLPQAVCSSLHSGLELGTASIKTPNSAGTATACCLLCHATPECKIFSFSNKSNHPPLCTLNTKFGNHNKTKSWATSGFVRGPAPPPPPPAPPPSPPPTPGTIDAAVHIAGGSTTFTVEPHYLSYTIDTSNERGFFQRDLTNPKLRWLARQLAPAVLRVGGSGGDELYYDVPHSPNASCPGPAFPKCKQSGLQPPPWAPSAEVAAEARGPAVGRRGGRVAKAGSTYCLNTSQWDALNGFVKTAGAKLVFGLNFFLNASSPQVIALLRYTVERNYSVYACECVCVCVAVACVSILPS